MLKVVLGCWDMAARKIHVLLYYNRRIVGRPGKLSLDVSVCVLRRTSGHVPSKRLDPMDKGSEA